MVCGFSSPVRNRGGNTTRLWTVSHPPASPFTPGCLSHVTHAGRRTTRPLHRPRSGGRCLWQPAPLRALLGACRPRCAPQRLSLAQGSRSVYSNRSHGQRKGDRQDMCLSTRPQRSPPRECGPHIKFCSFQRDSRSERLWCGALGISS